MNVVDSSCWLDWFADQPGAERFLKTVKDLPNLIVPSITLYEVFKRLLSQKGEETAVRAFAYMRRAQIVDLNPEVALASARLSLTTKLPLADSVILTTARMFNAILWTQDEHFKGMDGVKYFQKHKGKTPT
jgi:predicted nucleic acid-binding protein